jgi:hypothetical protein
LDGLQRARYNHTLSNHNPRFCSEVHTKVPASAAAFRLAKRFDEVGFSDIVKIRNRVMELRAQGKEVYQFEGGEPYRPTPDYIKDAIAPGGSGK